MSADYDDNGLVPLGVPLDEVMQEVRFKRNILTLHRLGPRATYEFIAEICRRYSIRTPVEALAERYAGLTIEEIEAAGAEGIPSPPLRAVTTENE